VHFLDLGKSLVFGGELSQLKLIKYYIGRRRDKGITRVIIKSLSKTKTTQAVKQNLSVVIELIRNIPNHGLYNTANAYFIPQSHTPEVAIELLSKIKWVLVAWRTLPSSSRDKVTFNSPALS
jgi:hypothetical protein